MLAMHLENVKISAGRYQRYVVGQYVAWQWPMLAVPLLVAALMLPLGWWKAALAIVMLYALALPSIMAWVIYYYTLTMEARWSVVEKDVDIDDSGITLSFHDGKTRNQHIAWTAVDALSYTKDLAVFKLSACRFAYLMLPLDDVADDATHDDAKRCMQWLNELYRKSLD